MKHSSSDSRKKKSRDEAPEVEEGVLDLSGDSKPSRDIGVKPPFFTGWERPLAPRAKRYARKTPAPSRKNAPARSIPRRERS